MRWKRLVGASTVTVLLAALGLEAAARGMDLDRLQHDAIALQGQRFEDRTWKDGHALGVAYLPHGFELERDALVTRFGTCDFDHDGLTVLVFGDSTTVQSSRGGDLHAGASWPDLLELPEGVQLCGVAELGYHPADYAELLQTLQTLLEPDLVLTLLCPNDLEPRRPRTGVRQPDGSVLLYEPPAYRLVVPGLWQPQLYQASEAFRFLHWRLALGQEEPHPMPVEVPGVVTSEEALASLLALAPTETFLLPDLGPRDRPLPASEARAWQERGRLVQLDEPLEQWRRSPDDMVHLNEQGHRVVAEQLQPVIDQLTP